MKESGVYARLFARTGYSHTQQTEEIHTQQTADEIHTQQTSQTDIGPTGQFDPVLIKTQLAFRLTFDVWDRREYRERETEWLAKGYGNRR